MLKYELPPGDTFLTPQALRVRSGRQPDPNVFTRWQQRGKVRKVRNGLYLPAEYRIESGVQRYALANQLYTPSYVSLLSALHYHSLIPEHVYETTSVSTRKTKQFSVDGRTYSYRTLQPATFFGYEVVEWSGPTYRMATPEKALLDLAYLEPDFADPNWLEEMRFDRDFLAEELNWAKLFAWAVVGGPRVARRIGMLKIVHDL